MFSPQNIVRRSSVARSKSVPTSPIERDEAGVDIDTRDESIAAENEYGDDRGAIHSDDRVLLIVDNDIGFAQFVLETARRLGFKGIVTPLGAGAIALAGDFQPHAILLDISLPDIDGWRILSRLKHDMSLQHIPVYVVSTTDHPERGIKLGAHGVLPKPIQTGEVLEEFLTNVRKYVDRRQRRIVAVDASGRLGSELNGFFDDADVEITSASKADAALDEIRKGLVDCVILTPDVADASVAEIAERVLAEANVPDGHTIFYLPPDTSPEGVVRWKQLACEFDLQIVESLPRLTEILLRSACLRSTQMSEPCRAMIGDAHEASPVLAGKKVMIVDDDIRNIFALISTLERHDIVTVSAETGRDAINLLQASLDVDIVLMDIMMPEMDGIDTMKAIRRISQFKKLPIIAVTAKAMKGDREKCIDAGAWDYLSKPVDTEQLLSVLRAWLAV
jgi:CheY-like chemotaxis protein